MERLMVNSQSGKRIQIIPATKNAGTENALKRSDGILRAAAYCRVSTDKEEQLNSEPFPQKRTEKQMKKRNKNKIKKSKVD